MTEQSNVTTAEATPSPIFTNTPSMGRIVHVLIDPALNNGIDVAPAIITRVWLGAPDAAWQCVNLRVIRDGKPDPLEWRTSCYLHPHEDAARAKAYLVDGKVSGWPVHAFWPARV